MSLKIITNIKFIVYSNNSDLFVTKNKNIKVEALTFFFIYTRNIIFDTMRLYVENDICRTVKIKNKPRYNSVERN